MSSIVVTGIGVTSAIGRSREANRQALTDGASGIGTLELFATRYAGTLPCAEIKVSDAELKEQLGAGNTALPDHAPGAGSL